MADICNNCRTKKRTDSEYKSLVNRLNRIEGQVRGIRNMVEEDAYCTDILMQVSAVTSALVSFNKELLNSHVRTCVLEDIKNDKIETLEELIEVIGKLMR